MVRERLAGASNFEIGAMIDQSHGKSCMYLRAYDTGSSWRQLRTISTGSSCPRGRYFNKANAHHVKAQWPEDNRLRAHAQY